MSNMLVKFPNGHEDDNKDTEFNAWWHLKTTLGDGERTACGLSFVDGYTTKEKERPRGGITCPQCLGIVQYYKKVPL